MNRGTGPQSCAKSVKAGIQSAWAESIPEFFEQQQMILNDRVKVRLLECLSQHEQRLAKLVETLRHTAADLFQVPYRPLQQEEALEIKRKPYWVLNTWNIDPLPILKSMDQRIDDLVRRNVENIRWSMLQNLNISFTHFTSRIKERLTETVTVTKGAMETANEVRTTRVETVDPKIIFFNHSTTELEKLKAEFLGRPQIAD